jgi:Fibronectin type III domain
MLRRRAALLLALTALTTTALVAPPPASATSCTAPCIESFTVNGATPDPAYDVTVQPAGADGEHQLLWNVTKSGDFELGAAARNDVFSFTIDTGTVVPRVAFTHGGDVAVTRTVDVEHDGTYHVTITASPILLTGECNQSAWPWTCPSTATQQWDGYLDGEITDYGSWDDVAQRSAMWGMNFATNIAATSVPPEIASDPTTGVDQLLVRLANPHYESNGTTVFHGFVQLRIPNSFLREAYGIDDPTTLTSAGLDPELTGTGGTVTVTQESGDAALLVDATGLTFSARTLRLHQGVIKPGKPTHLKAKRKAAHRAKLRFHASTARGSKVTGYKARCVAPSGKVKAKGHASPVKVTGLQAGVSYVCQVRAKSKAGKSHWSAHKHLRA